MKHGDKKQNVSLSLHHKSVGMIKTLRITFPLYFRDRWQYTEGYSLLTNINLVRKLDKGLIRLDQKGSHTRLPLNRTIV